MFGGERKKRVAKIAASAHGLLEEGESIAELVQVQTGRSAWQNATSVEFASIGIPYLTDGKVRSMAVFATEKNLYVITLNGARLLDAGEVVFKKPIADAHVEIGDEEIKLEGARLHVMAMWGKHVERLRSLVAAAR